MKAWLEGHQFDLEDLAQLLATGDVRVVQDTDEDGYYLTAPEIDKPPETNRFDIPAERLIVRANGLGRAKSADFRPVKFSGKCTTPDGRNLHFAAANLESRAHYSDLRRHRSRRPTAARLTIAVAESFRPRDHSSGCRRSAGHHGKPRTAWICRAFQGARDYRGLDQTKEDPQTRVGHQIRRFRVYRIGQPT